MGEPSDRYFPVTFEEEVIGNYTMRFSSIYADIPASLRSCTVTDAKGNVRQIERTRDSWVYYYQNPNLEYRDDTKLNVNDWIALYNLFDAVKRDPTSSNLLDKDVGMLKKVLGPNELFEHVLRTVIPEGVRMCKQKWQATAQDGMSAKVDMSIFFNQWRKQIWAQKLVIAANMQNPISHITQVNHIMINLGGSEVPDEVRLLAMGYYGRICAYETPAGQKLGISNTKALGARINENGLLETTYYKVVVAGMPDANGNIPKAISTRPEYFTAQQETEYKIGDRMSIEFNPDGTIKHTRVVARVPDGKRGHTVETVWADELDYVNAYSCQTLSPTAALVPFFGCDDSARLSLAAGMLKQSIMVQNNDKPRMYTSMYRRMFEHSNTYCATAKNAGYVTEVTNTHVRVVQPPEQFKVKLMAGNATIADDMMDTWPCDVYEVRPATVSRTSVNFINYHIKQGMWVNAGDVLFDSAITKDGVYSPGCNLFAAYIPDGYNYEDAIEVSESAANKLTSITVETVSKKIHAHGYTPHIEYSEGKYVSEKSTLATFKLKGTKVEQYREYMQSDLQSGILLGIERDLKDRSGSVYNGHLIAFNKSRVGDWASCKQGHNFHSSEEQRHASVPKWPSTRYRAQPVRCPLTS